MVFLVESYNFEDYLNVVQITESLPVSSMSDWLGSSSILEMRKKMILVDSLYRVLSIARPCALIHLRSIHVWHLALARLVLTIRAPARLLSLSLATVVEFTYTSFQFCI